MAPYQRNAHFPSSPTTPTPINLSRGTPIPQSATKTKHALVRPNQPIPWYSEVCRYYISLCLVIHRHQRQKARKDILEGADGQPLNRATALDTHVDCIFPSYVCLVKASPQLPPRLRARTPLKYFTPATHPLLPNLPTYPANIFGSPMYFPAYGRGSSRHRMALSLVFSSVESKDRKRDIKMWAMLVLSDHHATPA